MIAMSIRVELPAHLRVLAKIAAHEVQVEVAGTPTVPTVRTVLDGLEAAYPMLRGTIRDQVTFERRAFMRIFACQEDLSLDSPDKPLPDDVVRGAEPLIVLGAVAGGVLNPRFGRS